MGREEGKGRPWALGRGWEWTRPEGSQGPAGSNGHQGLQVPGGKGHVCWALRGQTDLRKPASNQVTPLLTGLPRLPAACR